jgi:hypothetical protein
VRGGGNIGVRGGGSIGVRGGGGFDAVRGCSAGTWGVEGGGGGGGTAGIGWIIGVLVSFTKRLRTYASKRAQQQPRQTHTAMMPAIPERGQGGGARRHGAPFAGVCKVRRRA